MAIRELLEDQMALRIEGWVGDMLQKCIQNGIMTEKHKKYAEVWQKQLDTDGGFRGEFWGKWMLSAVQAYQYDAKDDYRKIIENSVKDMLRLQEASGRLSCSAEDFTLWDIWGRKYTLYGLIAWYRTSGDSAVLDAACRMTDDLITQTKDAGIHLTNIGLGALQGLPSCSILKPVVMLYEDTGKEQYLDFARWIVDDWSKPSIYNAKGIRLVEEPLSGTLPAKIAAPKAYEMMSCYNGLCELYRATGQKSYLDSVIAFMDLLQEHEIMITGSGSVSELWCDGRYRQTQILENPMETCVTATYMELCHSLLQLTGESKWADALEISLFNALVGAINQGGRWWGYFNPLQGQRVPSHIQVPDTQSSCCVVNGPRALTDVPKWAMMRREDGFAVCLYQKGVYAGSYKGARFVLKQETDYPSDSFVRLSVLEAPEESLSLSLRIPSWCKSATITVNNERCSDIQSGWKTIRKVWSAGDVIELIFDMPVRIVSAPKNESYKALSVGPLVLSLDNRYNALPEHTSMWLMDHALKKTEDAQLNSCYYPIPALEDESELPFAEKITLDGTHAAYRISFLERRIHLWDHIRHELIFCDYASSGNDYSENTSIRTWLPQPLYTDTLFPLNTRKIINYFSTKEPAH